jgi:hypothetical protein
MSDSGINPRGFVEQDSPPANAKPPIPNEPLQRMLWYLTYSVEEAPQIEPESIVEKAIAVGVLHQAIALERIADALDNMNDRETFVPVPPSEQELRREAERLKDWRGEMERLAPTAPEYALRDPLTARHAFSETEGSVVCNKCGGGPLHSIHRDL